MSEWKEYLDYWGLDSDYAPNVPRVKVVDKDGKELFNGWYIGHINRQVCAFGDELREEDVDHLVAVDGFADWGMSRSLVIKKITPPERIEAVG